MRKNVRLDKGAFNNYVDKKRGRGVSQKSTLVHSEGGTGSLDSPRGSKPSYFRKYFTLFCTNGW